MGHWRPLVAVAPAVGVEAVPLAGAAARTHRGSTTASYLYVGVANMRPNATVGAFRNVPAAGGHTQPRAWTHDLRDVLIVASDQPIKNPSPPIESKPGIKLFSFLDDGTEIPTTISGDPSSGNGLSPFATHTSPDKMVHLVLAGQHGADASYDHGTHSLGANLPHFFHGECHVFYTLQHGQGNLYEVEPTPWAQGS